MTFDLPTLSSVESDGVTVWTDHALRKRGVVVAFSQRAGGVSLAPYASLNVASHVGDDAACVDENRDRFLRSVGLSGNRARLVVAEQVHGMHCESVNVADAGRGAFAAGGVAPVGSTDALMTAQPDLPLMLCFADCVPVVLVSPEPCVAVVHAGWRGALGGIVTTCAKMIAEASGCKPRDLAAYVGPHIGACHYQVDDTVLSQFVNAFGTVSRAESGGLDLGAVVAMSLRSAGVDPCNIASLGVCTAETTDRFFSYRAEAGLTGRHGALACIL